MLIQITNIVNILNLSYPNFGKYSYFIYHMIFAKA